MYCYKIHDLLNQLCTFFFFSACLVETTQQAITYCKMAIKALISVLRMFEDKNIDIKVIGVMSFFGKISRLKAINYFSKKAQS